MAETVAQKNRRIRQETLRELLAGKGLVEQVLVNIEKMEELQVVVDDDTKENKVLGDFELNKLKIANEQRLKLISKFLPDLKQSEFIGDPENPIEHNHSVTFKGVK